jgi:hypothetical protein
MIEASRVRGPAKKYLLERIRYLMGCDLIINRDLNASINI